MRGQQLAGRVAVALALCAAVLGVPTPAGAAGSDTWAGYLDYAYVYSSADARTLDARLREYGREAGMGLDRYVTEHFEAVDTRPEDEVATRRKAIAYLLDYLAKGEPDSLEVAVDTVRSLEDRLARHENRYWYHYILAHDALQKGRRFDFVGEILDLWLDVVVPLENSFETLQTLSLGDSPHSGFASALPYVYENIARMILLRSQEMGVDHDLDPLGAIVRLLHDGRVGAHPEVIPLEASSKGYLDRIVQRLEGPESDASSLTFTLALFEASKYHDRARGLLAANGLSDEAVKAIRVASGAYAAALDRADTVQGECAVYTRVLRQLGEVYAAKQRLGVDPEIEMPFTIEDAIDVYETMHRDREIWGDLGYVNNGYQAFVDAMHGLWEEIQETTLNASDYYLARTVEAPHLADEYSRNAARLLARYLSFFSTFATIEGKAGVPESAYFAAHEAARGVGDAYLAYALHPTTSEIDLATRHYRAAMKLFPFDRRLWTALTSALERQGRESEYMDLVRPAAESVTRSRSVNTWINNQDPDYQKIEVLRKAFSDSQALMVLGFADADRVDGLQQSLEELRGKRNEMAQRLATLRRQRDGWGSAPSAAATDPDAPVPPPAAPAGEWNAAELADLNRRITETSALLERLDRQLEARARTLPLYEATLETDGLSAELRARRDHPLHTLLRRMYYESREAASQGRNRK